MVVVVVVVVAVSPHSYRIPSLPVAEQLRTLRRAASLSLPPLQHSGRHILSSCRHTRTTGEKVHPFRQARPRVDAANNHVIIT